MPWPLRSPGSRNKFPKHVQLTKGSFQEVPEHKEEGSGRSNMVTMETEGAKSWFAGLRRAVQNRTKSSEATADSLQPAMTPRNRSQILAPERVRAHIQPTPQALVLVILQFDGQPTPGSARSWSGKRGHSSPFKALICILTSNLL